jgi:hypothetical protein
MVRFAFSICFVAAAAFSTDIQPNALTVHEWGTFTSIAADDGMAVHWTPLDGPTDLPCFVYRFEHGAKADLSGTVRMETPVIYFYGSSAASAKVRVGFPNGFITEWYPKANRVASYFGSGIAPRGPDVRQPRANEADSLEWPEVHLLPSLPSKAFPFEFASSHYYAARSTDAVPLLVGREKEKFLFYRGVGRFQPPISVAVTPTDEIVVGSLDRDPIPASILFENLDGRISYSVHGPIGAKVTFEKPQPVAGAGALKAEMEGILVSLGLFPKEAAAMVATWGDSWFEEGTRLFYFLPTSAIDPVLPLDIQPAPAQLVRAFVGRVEIFTHATKQAIANGDPRLIEKYGRFLGPIIASLGRNVHAATLGQLDVIRAQYLRRENACGTGGW